MAPPSLPVDGLPESKLRALLTCDTLSLQLFSLDWLRGAQAPEGEREKQSAVKTRHRHRGRPRQPRRNPQPNAATSFQARRAHCLVFMAQF